MRWRSCDDLFPPPVDGDCVYRVEKILDVWQPDEDEPARLQYLVKWFGYPLSAATWQWEWELSEARDAINDFLQRA
jgi:hypothetical protein